MTLEQCWRPRNDTGFGFHYYPDTEHYSPLDVKRWLPDLKKMGASWVVLLSRQDSPIPEFFVKALVGMEIEPVVRVVTPVMRSLDRSKLAEMLGVYAGLGVHYVEVFGEANCASEWPLEEWNRPSLVERFVDLLAPFLEEMQAAGLYLVFPALRPCGDYWDLSFLQMALELLSSRNGGSLCENMVIGMHNHAFDRPLTWGQGGRSRWPMARPYFAPKQSEDHIGFHLYEWYDQIVRDALGRSLPLLCMGSAAVGDPHSSTPSLWGNEEEHADRVTAIATMLMENSVPDYVLNHAFWLLATEEGHAQRVHAWYSADGRESRAVSALKGLLKHSRFPDADPPPDPPTPQPGRLTDVEFVGLSQEMVDGLRVAGPGSGGQPYWKVARVEVQPGTDSMSAYAVANAEEVRFSWPDGDHVVVPKDDAYAPVGARHDAASMPMFAGWGAYSVEVVGNSETLQGFGLYGDNLELTQARHHPVLVTFQHVSSGAIPPRPGPPDPAPPPEPPDPPPPSPPDPPPPNPPSPPPPAPPSGLYGHFPRPPEDNGMGVHFGLDMRSEAMALDIGRAKDMRLTWATLCYQGQEQLLRCARMIWDAGIMPVCRQNTPISRRHPFGEDARVLIDNGIPAYIQIFNEPSDHREWENERPRDYLEKWAWLWAEKAEDVYRSGGYPGLQCLLPQEVEAAIDALGADSEVWERVWFCCHNYGLNHPPAWHEDYWSVLGFLFFAQVFKDRLGFVPPIICGEGGWLYGASDDRRYPRVEGTVHAKYTGKMFNWFRRGKLSNGEPLPDYLFAACPWILSGPSDEAWYGFTTKVLTIQWVKKIPPFVRGKSVYSREYLESQVRHED